MIEILLALVCYSGGRCEEPVLPMPHEAAVVAMCESGDTLRVGSLDWEAVNVNVDSTRDTGAFQINSYWVWSGEDRWFINRLAWELKMSPDTLLAAWPTAGDAPPAAQLKAFYLLWDEGRGSSHWAASQHCWGPLLER